MSHSFSRRHTLGLLAATPLAIAATRASAATHTVMIEGFAFSPAGLEVAVGDTVVFTNKDGAPHTATDRGGAFDTGRINSGGSAEVTIRSAGTFDYFCKFHPNMVAQITAG